MEKGVMCAVMLSRGLSDSLKPQNVGLHPLKLMTNNPPLPLPLLRDARIHRPHRVHGATTSPAYNGLPCGVLWVEGIGANLSSA